MIDYVEQGEVKQLLVQRKDGSTWRAEIGLDGRVRLVEQLNQPTKDTEADHEDQANEQGDEYDQADQQEQGEADQQDGEQDEGETSEEQWGQATPVDDKYTDSEIDKLIGEMQQRGSTNKTDSGKFIPDNYILSPEYHAKLKDPAFLSRIQSVMLDNKYARRVRGRTRGKLDMGRLFKVPTMSRNVFLQKQERKGKEYNVVLTVDQSGSMSGRKQAVAAEAALFLVKQFEHLNINIGIIGYGDNVHVIKELNNHKNNYNQLYMGLMQLHGGTNDYPALRRAYHMFETAPEGQNILIHLSDGGPGWYMDANFYDVNGNVEHIRRLPNILDSKLSKFDQPNYNEKEHLHHLVKSHPDVTAVGIGIEEGGWQIPEHFVIHKLDDLKPAILRVLRQNIKRG